MSTYKGINWKGYPSTETPLDEEHLNEMDQGVMEAHEEIQKITDQIRKIADIVYPVGSIYISTRNVNPSNLFGGVWSSWGSGRTLMGVNGSDDDFCEEEKTGGQKQVRLEVANLPPHSHGYTPSGDVTGTTASGTVEIDNNLFGGTVNHRQNDIFVVSHDVASGSKTINPVQLKAEKGTNVRSTLEFKGERHSHSFSGERRETENTGAGTPVGTMPPYITCYFWKRIE